MVSIEVKIPNQEKFLKFFKEAPDELRKEVGAAIAVATKRVRDEAALVTPVDTGRLKGSLTPDIDRRSLQGIVFSNVDYAEYVHEGTRFMTGRPFLRWGVANSQQFIDKVFADALKNLQRKLR